MAAPVEMEFPEFSKKVVEQGTDSDSSKEECTVEKDATGEVSSMTCGANSPYSTQSVRKTEASDYAQEQVRKTQQKRR